MTTAIQPLLTSQVSHKTKKKYHKRALSIYSLGLKLMKKDSVNETVVMLFCQLVHGFDVFHMMRSSGTNKYYSGYLFADRSRFSSSC